MTAKTQRINIDQKDLDLPAFQAAMDLVSGQLYPLSGQISLRPYQTLWLKL
jgi:hypothetical protein